MSIKLPHGLVPWEAQLRIFPEEIALALGPMVQKVAALVGPCPHHHSEGRVVPDGFAGLAKRGSYDRLVVSDWLLAEELPEEFTRRSVMGEHLFWKIAYREPAQSRSTLLLFDAGPEQLGSPRLLHLAALAVFDARARSAKANFAWGILQHSEQGSLPGTGTAEVANLLNARGNVSAQPEHFAAWLQHTPDARMGGETWVVGSERLRSFLPETVSSLLVRDVMTPGERKLRAECRPARRHSRTIELGLPPQPVCAQLLRDPFAAAIISRRKLEVPLALASMVFDPSGDKLWAKLKQGNVMVFPVSNSPRDKVGEPKQYKNVNSFPQVAAGRVGRTTVLISMDPASLNLHVTAFGRSLPRGLGEGGYEFVDSRTRPLFRYVGLSICVWQGLEGQKPGLYLLDESGSLLRLYAGPAGRWCEVVHSHAVALSRSVSGFCYATYERRDGGLVRVFVDNHSQSVRSWPAPVAPYHGFFGYSPPVDIPVFGQLALRYADARWEICNTRTRTRVNVPIGFSVHGVIRNESYEETLIVVEGDRRTLSLYGAHGTRRLLKARASIVAASGCQRRPFIAYATEAGDISVYSLKHGKAVLDFAGSAT